MNFDLYYLNFSAIYSAGLKKGRLSTERQVKRFLEIVSFEKMSPILEEEGEDGSLPFSIPDREIPCLAPLKLTTINCLLAGMDYFYCLFPDLAPVPYGTDHVNFFKLQKIEGITCHIKILSPDNFTVLQLKSFNVCLSGDINTVVATLEISWKVGPKENEWEGTLGIDSCTIHAKKYHNKLMEILLKPVMNAKSNNLPNGVTFFPKITAIKTA